MTAPVLSIGIEESADVGERVLREKNVSCLAVRGRDGRAVGVISRTDLLQVGHVLGRAIGTPAALTVPTMVAGDLMTRSLVSVGRGASVREAARRMVEHQIHRVFVVDDQGHPVGVFSSKDAMRAIIDARLARPLADVMTRPVPSVDVDTPLSEAVEKLTNARLTGLIVTEEELPVGAFGQGEALEARDLPTTTRVEDAMGHSLICLPAATPLFRAAAFAIASQARRLVAASGEQPLAGILTGVDFARAVAGLEPGTLLP